MRLTSLPNRQETGDGFPGIGNNLCQATEARAMQQCQGILSALSCWNINFEMDYVGGEKERWTRAEEKQ